MTNNNGHAGTVFILSDELSWTELGTVTSDGNGFVETTTAAQEPDQERAPASLEDRIDRAIAGLCPCGADPSPEHSPYCSYDCVPNIGGVDTDAADAGVPYATPMRWQPDLVSAADDRDMIVRQPRRSVGGGFWAQTFQLAGADRLHLRLDDGYRFVGTDLDLADPGTLPERTEQTWAKLRRELTDRRQTDSSSRPYLCADPQSCPVCRYHSWAPHAEPTPYRDWQGWVRAYQFMARRQEISISPFRGGPPASAGRAVDLDVRSSMSRILQRLGLMSADRSGTQRADAEQVLRQRRETLERVRNRGTGPRAQPRAPRRIDPGRAGR